jgi:hypothetical protein
MNTFSSDAVFANFCFSSEALKMTPKNVNNNRNTLSE